MATLNGQIYRTDLIEELRAKSTNHEHFTLYLYTYGLVTNEERTRLNSEYEKRMGDWRKLNLMQIDMLGNEVIKDG